MSATRPAVAADLAVLTELERDCFGSHAWPGAVLAVELARVPETRCVLVAPAGGDVLAYVVLMMVAEVADLTRIAVSPGARRLGLARELLAAASTQALRHGCDRMLLEVRTDNVQARGLYTAAGFEPIDVRRGYYGPGVDALVLCRRL